MISQYSLVTRLYTSKTHYNDLHSTHLSLVCIPAKHTIKISQYSLVTRLYTSKTHYYDFTVLTCHSFVYQQNTQFSLVTRLYTSKTHYNNTHSTYLSLVCIPAKHTMMISQYSLVTRLYTSKTHYKDFTVLTCHSFVYQQNTL